LIAETPRHVFFFQAEDGIRDFHVTGVQTCALPIWSGAVGQPNLPVIHTRLEEGGTGHWRSAVGQEVPWLPFAIRPYRIAGVAGRSEERRVGRERRRRWARQRVGNASAAWPTVGRAG